jgi:hypothetical protein
MLMYYEDRFEAKEMHSVLTHMREAHRTIRAPGEDAHGKLIEWGATIKRQFIIDNLHLSGKQAHDNSAQVIHAVKQVSSSIASSHVVQFDTARRVVELELAARRIEGKLDTLISLFSGTSLASIAPVSTSPAPAAASFSAATLSSAIASAAAASSAATAASSPPVSTSRAPSRTPSSLVHSSTHAAPGNDHLKGEYTLTKPKTSGRLFLDYMTLGSQLPPAIERDGRRRPDANRVVKAYEAMANAEEREVLHNPQRDDALANTIVKGLTELLVKRVLQSYDECNPSKKPKELSTNSTVYVNTMVDNLRDSRIFVESSSFAAWRAQPQSSAQPSGKRVAAVSTSSPSRSRPQPRLGSTPPGGYEESQSSSNDEDGDEDGGEDGDEMGDGMSQEEEEEEQQDGGSPEKGIQLDSDSDL